MGWVVKMAGGGLAIIRCSLNICWMDGWMDGWMKEKSIFKVAISPRELSKEMSEISRNMSLFAFFCPSDLC